MEWAFESTLVFPERIQFSGLCYSIVETNLCETIRLYQVGQMMFARKGSRRRTSACALQALHYV